MTVTTEVRSRSCASSGSMPASWKKLSWCSSCSGAGRNAAVLIFQQTLGGEQLESRGEILRGEGVGHELLNLLGAAGAVQQGHNLVEEFSKRMSFELDATPLRSNHQGFVAARIGGFKAQ